jgi:Holliday junction resolvase
VTTPEKAKGSQWERDVAKVFNEMGYPHVERRYGAGNTVDKGDLNGFAHAIVIECKNLKSITLSTIMDETARERANAKADIGLAVIKRRNKPARQAYAVVTLEEMIYLLKQAGY